MGNEIVIRKIGSDETGTIINLAEAVWPSTYKGILPPDQIDYMMRLFYSESSLAEQFTKHTFLVADFDDTPVGFASYSSSSADGVYKLHKIYVNTSIQGRGLGKALISFIVEELKTLQATALELNVNRHNKARTFYEKSGFKVIREEDVDIGQNFWMNDYVMRLEI